MFQLIAMLLIGRLHFSYKIFSTDEQISGLSDALNTFLNHFDALGTFWKLFWYIILNTSPYPQKL